MGAIKIKNIYLRLQLKPQFVPILCLYIHFFFFKKKTHFCAHAYAVCTLASNMKYHLLITKGPQ